MRCTNTFEKIQLDVDSSFEKWQSGIVVEDQIFFLPYNESKILIVDTKTNNVEYLTTFDNKGKWLCPHIYKNNIIALPYGEHIAYRLTSAVSPDSLDASFPLHILAYPLPPSSDLAARLDEIP